MTTTISRFLHGIGLPDMPSPRSSTVVVACLILVLSWVSQVSAHPGIHHDQQHLNQQLADRPDCVTLLVRRAHLYRLGDDPAAAVADAERALALVPGHREAILQRGMALSALRRDREADLALSDYLGAGGAKLMALKERGDVRRRLGRPAEAIADYNAVLIRHDVLDVYLARGALQESLGDLDSAVTGYRRGFDRMHHAAALRLALIRVETARRRYDAARSLIDEALVRSASKARWLLRRADVSAAAGDSSAAETDRRMALDDATQALRRKPTVLNRCLRAEARLALNMRSEALEDIRLAASVSPLDPAVCRLRKKVERAHDGNAEPSPDGPVMEATHVEK